MSQNRVGLTGPKDREHDGDEDGKDDLQSNSAGELMVEIVKGL